MNFDLISKFKGYATKPDPTNLAPEYLVAGSLNCLINDGEMIESRRGYQLDGEEDTTVAPVTSSYEWDTSSDSQIALKAANSLLTLRYEDSEGNITYEALATLTAEILSFTTRWNNTRKYDELYFVDGSTNLYEWSGAIATFASATTNTVTIEGSATITSKRFHTSGTRGFRIKDSGGTWREFTYTGGESGQQFTTVSPDPTAFTFDVGAPIFQSVRTNANTPASDFSADFITTIKNQLVIGSRTSRLVYVSKASNPLDYTFSSPRVPGDGELITLDNSGRAAVAIEDVLLLSAGRDDWYRVEFEQITVGSTLSEQVKVKKLKTSSGQGALHHDLVTTIGNAVVFVSADNTMRSLGYAENYPDLQMKSLSEIIQPDFDAADFSGGHIKTVSQEVYITAPNDSRVFILDISGDAFWQPPQILPFRRMAIIDGELYGHSNATPESYAAFAGYSDRTDADGENGRPITSTAKFAYRQFDNRPNLKSFELYRSEGYMSLNTTLSLTLNYDFGGATAQVEKTIAPVDEETGIEKFIFQPQASNVLGDQVLGDLPQGSEEEASDMPKFIIEHQLEVKDFFELQTIYSSTGVDQRWQLLAHGPSVKQSPNQPTFIRK